MKWSEEEQNAHFHNFLKAVDVPPANKYITSTKEPSFSIPHKQNAGKKPSQKSSGRGMRTKHK